MIPKEKLTRIENTASEVVEVINESTRWINNFLRDEERSDCNYDLKKCRRQINKIKAVVTQKPVIALFGASQVGKSYMANNLLYNSENKLEVFNHQDASTIDFIKYINPQGDGNEATGAVTRFTSDVETDINRYPVKLKIFNPKDVICIICDTYYNDFKEQDNPLPKRSQIIDFISGIQRMKSSVKHQYLTDDDVYSIKEYLEKYFSDKAFIIELEETGFWDSLADNIQYISSSNWVNIFSFLWNNHEELNQVFDACIIFLGTYDFPKFFYVKFDTLLRDSVNPVIDVRGFIAFFDNLHSFEVQVENGQIYKADSSKLCFLTSEIVLSVSEGSVINRPFIKEVDIIDFPGARSRDELMVLTPENLFKMMVRGKVAYLFNSYSTDFKTNILAVCMRTEQSNVTTVPGLINRWIQENLGKTPEQRGLNLLTDHTPLFIIFTWWNKQLQYLEATDDPDPKDKIKKLFETRYSEEIIKAPFNWHDEWKIINNTTSRFDNFYLLRDFKRSDNIFKRVNGAEDESNPYLTGAIEEYNKNYREKFLEYHNSNKKFFRNPSLNFNEASIPNKDGSELIIKNLMPLSSNKVFVPIYINHLNGALTEARSKLKKHYHSDKADEQIKKAAKEGSDLQLKMDIVFGMDAYYFGSFIEHLTISESEVLKFYHDLLQSEKLVKKKDTNTYILLRLMNPGIKAELSYEENLEVLRLNYNKDSAEETEKHFKESEKIDLNELFYGDMYNLQNNSIILAEEARDYWYKTKLNLENFSFFTGMGFDKTLLTRLFETMQTSFEKHHLTKAIAEEIRNYVDVQKRIEKAEDMIAHITAGIINEFVNSVGWTYYPETEKEKFAETNRVNSLNLKLPNEQETFNAIERISGDDPTQMSLEKLIDYMDNLNENLSRRPIDKEVISYVPMVKNYQRWSELMKVAFISNCDIPTYNIEANNKLAKILDKIEGYNFSIA